MLLIILTIAVFCSSVLVQFVSMHSIQMLKVRLAHVAECFLKYSFLCILVFCPVTAAVLGQCTQTRVKFFRNFFTVNLQEFLAHGDRVGAVICFVQCLIICH